jgi:hypothetical protein
LRPQDSGCGQLGLRDEIVGKGQGGAKQFAAPGGAVLRKLRGGQDQLGFGEQFFEGGKLGSVRCHVPTIRRASWKSNRSLFSLQRTFQTLPNFEVYVQNAPLATIEPERLKEVVAYANAMRIPALALLIGSCVFCLGMAATLRAQVAKPVPPTPIDKKKVELGGSPWDPEWDQIVEKALPAEMPKTSKALPVTYILSLTRPRTP